MYEIAIIQLSGKTYFWVLRQKQDGKVTASSQLIADETLVKNEAYFIAGHFGLDEPVIEKR